MVFLNIYTILFNVLNIHLKLWMGIIIVMLLPIVINMVLKKFNLQKDNIGNYMRWK